MSTRRWLPLLKVAVSLGLLVALALRFDLGTLAQRLAGIETGWVLAAIAAFSAGLVAGAVRWKLAMHALGLPVALRRLVALTFAGGFFNQVLVSSIGGDVVKAWLLHREHSRLATVVLSLVIDRLVGVLGLGIVIAGAMALPQSQRLGDATRSSVLYAGLALAAGLLVLIALAFRRRRAAPAAGTALRRLRDVAAELRDAVRVMLLRPHLSLTAGGLAVIVHLLSIVAAWCAARAVGADVGAQALIVCVPLALLAAMAPISIGGWGVREGALVALLHLYGTPPDAALALSIVLGVSLIGATLPGVVVWLAWRQGTRHEQVRASGPDGG